MYCSSLFRHWPSRAAITWGVKDQARLHLYLLDRREDQTNTRAVAKEVNFTSCCTVEVRMGINYFSERVSLSVKGGTVYKFQNHLSVQNTE